MRRGLVWQGGRRPRCGRDALSDSFGTVIRPEVLHRNARNTASGSVSSTVSNTAAGADGCRLPCSQFCSVFTLTPTSFALSIAWNGLPAHRLSRVRRRVASLTEGGVLSVPGVPVVTFVVFTIRRMRGPSQLINAQPWRML